jgi:DNA-directed RNA polymerase subunit RPC12/RpoP
MRTYLPMDCPVCGRRRLLAEIATLGHHFVRSIECEKCGTRWPEGDDD